MLNSNHEFRDLIIKGKSIINVKQAIEYIEQLNHNEKAFMARYLISSLEIRQDENVDVTWAELAEKRYEELVSRKVQSVSWEEIKKMIRHYKESESERLEWQSGDFIDE